MKLLNKIVILVAATLVSASLQAIEPYRMDFGGTITIANLSSGSTDSTLVVGSSFSGFCLFDIPAMDLDSSANAGNYPVLMPNSFAIEAGSYSATAPDFYSFQVKDNVDGFDSYLANRSAGAWSGPGDSDGLNVSMALMLTDSTQTALSSDDILTSMPPLSAWDTKKIQVGSNPGNPGIFLEGQIEWMSVSAVPEPATLGAFITGLVGAYRLRRSRRK